MKLPLIKVISLLMIGVLALVSIVSYLYYQTSRSSKAAGETIFMSFSPNTTTTGANTDFTVTLKAKPSTDMLMRGYQFRINFDNTKVKIKTITYVGSFAQESTDFGDDTSTAANTATLNTNGYITLIGEDHSASGFPITAANEYDVATLVFTSSGSTASTISVDSDPNNSFLVKTDEGGFHTDIPVGAASGSTMTVSVNGGKESGTTPVPSATSTPTGTGNIKLNLKLKFQGILKKPAAASTMAVHVKLGGAQVVDCGSGTFTSDDNGIWSGTVNCNTTPGSGFIVYTKGPKQIQKKICEATPTESDVSPGSYHCAVGKITLAAGDNNLDFSGILQMSGDLPVSGGQDGAVTSLDTSFIRNNLGSTDPAVLAIGDVNLDGKIDTQDWSLVIAALSVRGDEE